MIGFPSNSTSASSVTCTAVGSSGVLAAVIESVSSFWIVILFPATSVPSICNAILRSLSLSALTSAIYKFPSASLLARADNVSAPFAMVGTSLNSVFTILSPNPEFNILNTYADGVEKNVNVPSPVVVFASAPLTTWITACCVGPKESLPSLYQSERQCFWI